MISLERCVPRSGLPLSAFGEVDLHAPYPGPWHRTPTSASALLWSERISSIRDAAAAFQTLWPQAARLTTLSVRRLRGATDVAQTLAYRHPEVRAAVLFSRDELLAGDLDARLSRHGDAGDHVYKTLFELAWHEFGHVVTEVIVAAMSVGDVEQLPGARDCLIREACRRSKMTRPAAEVALSARAEGVGSDPELLAEAFTDAAMRGRRATPFSRELRALCGEAWPQ